MKYVIDAGLFGGAPLTKKYAMFHSGLVPMARYRRDMGWFDAVDPQSLRIDLFIGETGLAFGDVVTGTPDKLVYDFSSLDELTRMLRDKQVLPYWSWCYMPKPVQLNNDFRQGPSDRKIYADILEHFAAHYRETGLRLGYQEVYNEPDCNDVFFAGSYEDYLKLYEAGAPALRRGDKDAVVGGPSSAFVLTDEEQRSNLSAFLRFVREKELPLDFFSYHSYGYEEGEYVKRTDMVRELIGNEAYYKATEMHMNELNVIPPAWEYGSEAAVKLGGRCLLPLAFDAMRALAAYTDLTIVHWAQLLNSGVDALGLVNADGTACPGYAAFDIYQRMPVRRLHTMQQGNVQLMASADGDRVSLVMWNKHDAETLQLDWMNLPFEEGEISLYMLDEKYFASYDGQLTATRTLPLAAAALHDMELTLGRDDVIYVEINRAGAMPRRRMPMDSGKAYVRTRYYFEERGRNTVAYFSEKRSAAYLGMGGSDKGLAVCASEMDAQQNAQLTVTAAVKDLRSSHACLAIRVDYQTDAGWAKADVYTGNHACRLPLMPFGTQKAADEVLPLEGETLHIDLAARAPASWNGRVLVTYMLKDAGANSWVELNLR